MIITTSSKIWAHRNFLTLVHQANEIIEREAGPKSETLAVYWGLNEAARNHRIPEYGEHLPPRQRRQTRKTQEGQDGAHQRICPENGWQKQLDGSMPSRRIPATRHPRYHKAAIVVCRRCAPDEVIDARGLLSCPRSP